MPNSLVVHSQIESDKYDLDLQPKLFTSRRVKPHHALFKYFLTKSCEVCHPSGVLPALARMRDQSRARAIDASASCGALCVQTGWQLRLLTSTQDSESDHSKDAVHF